VVRCIIWLKYLPKHGFALVAYWPQILVLCGHIVGVPRQIFMREWRHRTSTIIDQSEADSALLGLFYPGKHFAFPFGDFYLCQRLSVIITYVSIYISMIEGLPSSEGRPRGNPWQIFHFYFGEFPLGPGLPLANFGLSTGNTVGVTGVFLSVLRTWRS